ncbi:DUF1028 domain-containing protein [Halovenus rubra]|uniref:DUF1028 domain-containing protein n=2 Tax=Halovenus rubra TaxID=869890 RepID=A0ACC7DYI2_9EURY|nr:DUF1028 domain-containing protein [Halovenus rubra]
MTFSICVREQYEDDEGTEQYRFGVAVTTRLAGVGTLCPFANEYGAVATQSLVNVNLGRTGIEYLEDGLAVGDALEALLQADDGESQRQLHGVDKNGEFAFSGEECKGWFGHTVGENYTVAGNLLTGESVIDATAEAYEESKDEDRPLAFRLADALATGHAEGGDKREELHVQSAALLVRDTQEYPLDPSYNDIRVDATETPVVDLQETLALAQEGHEMAMERYEEEYEEDEMTD